MSPDASSELTPGEVAVACARYGLADVKRADALGAGSGHSPKTVLTLADGTRLLLKRRGPGHDDPSLVRFTHDIQHELAAHAYPVAPLRDTLDGDSMLTIDGHIYELFEFVVGSAYDRSVAATTDAGRGLAFFHKILAKHMPSQRPARATYHDAPPVRAQLESIAGDDRATPTLSSLYSDAATRVGDLGLDTWPRQIIHGDWHPGNMLFRKGKVAAVLDYDAATMGPRAADIAYGGVQFSMTSRPTGPADWPEESDLRRLKAFFTGYEAVPGGVISKAEIEALPWLMVEALIAEAAFGVRDGRFGPFESPPFLSAIRAKATWLIRRRDEVRGCLNI